MVPASIAAINIRPSAGLNRFTRSGRVYREYYTKFMVSVAGELARNVRRIELGGISVAAFAIDHPEEDLSRENRLKPRCAPYTRDGVRKEI